MDNIACIPEGQRLPRGREHEAIINGVREEKGIVDTSYMYSHEMRLEYDGDDGDMLYLT